MGKIKYYILISLWLIFLSLIMFYFHYKVFGQLENTIYYSLMSICIIPINILAVTIVFEKLMERQKRFERMGKINMLVGLFFSDVGYSLLNILSEADIELNNISIDYNNLKIAKNFFKSHKHTINLDNLDYKHLEEIVLSSKDILSNLLSNENILEHETFTDLLLSLMHLRDELILLKLKEASKDDLDHITGDIIRVYMTLTTQWISYLEHLKGTYPYMYTGAIKLSPFKNSNIIQSDKL